MNNGLAGATTVRPIVSTRIRIVAWAGSRQDGPCGQELPTFIKVLRAAGEAGSPSAVPSRPPADEAAFGGAGRRRQTCLNRAGQVGQAEQADDSRLSSGRPNGMVSGQFNAEFHVSRCIQVLGSGGGSAPA